MIANSQKTMDRIPSIADNIPEYNNSNPTCLQKNFTSNIAVFNIYFNIIIMFLLPFLANNCFIYPEDNHHIS